MTARGRLGALALLAGLLGALGPGLARAQAPSADPLADFDFAGFRELQAQAEPGEGVPLAEQIAESQQARASCNVLVDDINGLLAQWQLVRAEELDRETFSTELQTAVGDWNLDEAQCRVDLGKLQKSQQSSYPVNTLAWEHAQLVSLWEALAALCRAWVNDRPRPDIDVAAKTFSGRLAKYAGWLEVHTTFWDGSWLAEERDQTCVGDTKRTAENLASRIREQMVVPPSQRDPVATQDLFKIRNALETTVAGCTGELSPLQEMELKVLAQKIAAYGRAIAALEAGDAAALQAAMDREQELTGRLLRCRREHSTDAVSAACTPQ